MIDVHIPANLFYPELPGGFNQYYRYGPFLRERGVQLHVHTIKKPHHEDAELEIRGIKVRRYEVPEDFGMLAEMNYLTDQAIREIKIRRPERVCLHPLGTLEASIGSIARLWKARLGGIPTCFHYMMVPVRRSFPGRQKELIISKVVLSPYSKMLMCSAVMGRAFTDVVGVSPRRIEVVPNGIDLSVFSPVSEERKRELRSRLEIPQDVPIVLYVGSVVPRKGVDILIKAWAGVLERQPRAQLVIAGSIGRRPTVRESKASSELETYGNRILEQVSELRIPDSVRFVGEVENIRDFYQASDLFAFASHHEGLPSVILEAMACGVPCVTAPFVGLPADGEEYGVDGEHFLKSSHDPERMAADLISLLENDDVRRRMGEKAAAWIRETQEMGTATDRLASIYEEMAGKG